MENKWTVVVTYKSGPITRERYDFDTQEDAKAFVKKTRWMARETYNLRRSTRVSEPQWSEHVSF